MPLSPIPNRSLLPKSDDMVCPDTVKQTMSSSFGQAVPMVSPENSAKESSSSSRLSLASQVRTFKPAEQRPFQLAREAVQVATSSGSANYSNEKRVLAPRSSERKKEEPRISPSGLRLNKFVSRLHDMLQAEKDSGVVEWRRGLLVLHSTDAFAKTILPKYFNTRNFKTFRRQLNYYGFVHVRSFSTTGSTTTALWVNRDLAQRGTDDISSVLMLKRVEPTDDSKTAEGRRVRKEQAIFTVEEDIGVSPKSLQMDQIRSLANEASCYQRQHPLSLSSPQIPLEVHCRSNKDTPLLPRLSQKVRNAASREALGQASRSNSLAQNSQTSSVTHSEGHQDPQSETTVESDAEEDAACLLLMLSKGRSDGAQTANSPLGQFLM